MIGTTLRRQRELLGTDLTEVARIAAISEARLRTIEGGDPPSVWELSAISQAVGLPVANLLNGALDDPRRGVARFRASGTALSAADTRLLALSAEAGRIAGSLHEALGFGKGRVVAARSVEAVAVTPDPWQQGYRLGSLARQRLGIPAGPIESVERLLEKCGVCVLRLPFSSDAVDGASMYESSALPIVIVNSNGARYGFPLSRRAILAHELCHVLHDSSADRDMTTIVSRSGITDGVEQRANGFAPNFIAPRDGIDPRARREAVNDPATTVRRLGADWGLSFEGAAYHAKNLKLIRAEDERQLLERPRQQIPEGRFGEAALRVDLGPLGLEGDEQAALDRSPFAQSKLGELAMFAFRRDLITRARAIEILAFGSDVVH